MPCIIITISWCSASLPPPALPRDTIAPTHASRRIASQCASRCASPSQHTQSTANPAPSYESFKKAELEVALDEYLAEHAARFSSRSNLAGYYNSRSKALGSPVKRESGVKDEGEKPKVTKRKPSLKPAEDATA